MDERQRQEYLEAMGIPVWVSRTRPRPQQASSYPDNVVTDADAEIDGQSTPGKANPPRVDDVPEPPPWVIDESIPAQEQQVTGSFEDMGSDTADRRETIGAMDWEPLREAVLSCTSCSLHASRTQAVFGVGNPDAQWMIIGEAPGADEDRLGEPFVGRAGKLLDKMLQAVGVDRSRVFIANVLKCRPPNNRDPIGEESGACRPYLERQIELVSPRLILSVGRVSAQNLLECDTAVGRLRGRIHRFGRAGIPLVVTYHPAYLLRRPIEKRKAWEDLKLAMSALEPPEG